MARSSSKDAARSVMQEQNMNMACIYHGYILIDVQSLKFLYNMLSW